MRAIIVIIVIIAIVGAGGFLLVRRMQGTLSGNGTTSGTSLPTAKGNTDTPSAGTVTIAKEITFNASEFKFEPSEIRIKKGETVKITMKNTGSMPHDWLVENMMGASIDQISPSQSGSITVTPSQKGTFTTYCSIGQHRKLGMVGKLIVE